MSAHLFSEVRFEELETMHVASTRRVSRSSENDVTEFMTRWAQRHGIDPKARKLGFDVSVSEAEKSKGLRGYEYWTQALI